MVRFNVNRGKRELQLLSYVDILGVFAWITHKNIDHDSQSENREQKKRSFPKTAYYPNCREFDSEVEKTSVHAVIRHHFAHYVDIVPQFQQHKPIWCVVIKRKKIGNVGIMDKIKYLQMVRDLISVMNLCKKNGEFPMGKTRRFMAFRIGQFSYINPWRRDYV